MLSEIAYYYFDRNTLDGIVDWVTSTTTPSAMIVGAHWPGVSALLVRVDGTPGAPTYGVLIAGLNRYRPLDEDYRSFLGLVANQVSASLSNARAYEAERQRAEDLAALDRAKTAFFTNVSHEFRTPLTLIVGPTADALADRDDPLSAPQRARVETIHQSSERLLKLVNSLLDFSRLESGRTEAQLESVDLSEETLHLARRFTSDTVARWSTSPTRFWSR